MLVPAVVAMTALVVPAALGAVVVGVPDVNPQPTRTHLRTPDQADVGDRPLARIRVRVPGDPATTPEGLVRISVDGGSLGWRPLDDGRIRWRLPRLDAGQVRVFAEYVGSTTTQTSTATRTIQVGAEPQH